MKEMIDELNDKGEVIGVIDKDVAHKEGKLHRSIHLWIINDDGEILLQYRCGSKKLYPNTWDVSVGGHVSTKENSIDALSRETKEELGIDLDLGSIEYLGNIHERLKYDEIDSNELVDVFIARQNINKEDIVLQKDEVSDIRFVSIEELFRLMYNNQLLPHENEYKKMLEYLVKLKLSSTLRRIDGYPKAGINFKDVTTILKDPFAYHLVIDSLACQIDKDVDIIIGPEARGIMFAAPVAYKLNKGFVPVRKPNKLPAETIQQEYSLEYGTDTLEIHKDAIKPGQNVAIIDDLMATGGTMEAIIKLVERLGGNVTKVLCLIDLPELGGAKRLSKYDYDYILSESEKEKTEKKIYTK